MTVRATAESISGGGIQIQNVDPHLWFVRSERTLDERLASVDDQDRYILFEYDFRTNTISAQVNNTDYGYRRSLGVKNYPTDFITRSSIYWSPTHGIHQKESRIGWMAYGRLKAEEVNTVLNRIHPYVCEMIDQLQRVEGHPTALDWSARSLFLHDIIAQYVTYQHGDGPDEEASKHRVLITYQEASKIIDIGRGEWALWNNEELDKFASYYANRSLIREDDIDKLQAHLEAKWGPTLTGLRSWIYSYREEAAQGLRVTDAREWYKDSDRNLGTRMNADWDEEYIEQNIAPKEQRSAANSQKALVGLMNYLLGYRAELRDIARNHLSRLGELANQNSTPELRTQIAAQVLRIIGWNDPKDGDSTNRDETIGKLAGMSPEAVAILRTRISGVDTWDGPIGTIVVREAPTKKTSWWKLH